MKSTLLNLYVKFQGLKNDEGQDLVEYGLIVTAIALAAIGGIEHFASAVATLFSNIDNSIS